mmetsp:Transcript_125003/g.229406  ORF Transcript_125003/g.229406 Transcript_125003/m.229406 type:complete len:311 (+) Transcript_125003:309-1241(+)
MTKALFSAKKRFSSGSNLASIFSSCSFRCSSSSESSSESFRITSLISPVKLEKSKLQTCRARVSSSSSFEWSTIFWIVVVLAPDPLSLLRPSLTRNFRQSSSHPRAFNASITISLKPLPSSPGVLSVIALTASLATWKGIITYLMASLPFCFAKAMTFLPFAMTLSFISGSFATASCNLEMIADTLACAFSTVDCSLSSAFCNLSCASATPASTSFTPLAAAFSALASAADSFLAPFAPACSALASADDTAPFAAASADDSFSCAAASADDSFFCAAASVADSFLEADATAPFAATSADSTPAFAFSAIC